VPGDDPPVTDSAAFGNALQRRRLAARLTQLELADRAGVSVRTIRDLESGRVHFPRATTVQLLAGVLGVPGADPEEFVNLASRNYWARRAEEPSRHEALQPQRQLPPEIAAFIGREPEIAAITKLLTSSAPAVVAIDGMGGVGKTALAVHVAHRLADRFPDGQLYANLRGQTSGDVLCRLMRAVGAGAEEVVDELDEAAARFRSVLAGRRVLIVLDDAAGAEQVAPLLPGTADSAAIITSRRVLAALPQARHVPLGVPTEAEAVAQFATVVGRPRVDREPDAAADVVRRCGLLPLAIHVAGVRLASRPRWSITHVAERLAWAADRLDELERDDVGVRACFAASVDRLVATHRGDARAFGLLGCLDRPTMTVERAAHLLNLSEADAERTLERLADLHLIEAESPTRYRMHDLLRIYARERAPHMVADIADARRDRAGGHLVAARAGGTR
jgi:transcriptional regulator with XRE-family HTH domain